MPIRRTNLSTNMISALIQARMGSSRLPGKVMLPIQGRPMLDYLLSRVMLSKLIDQIVVIIPDTPENDVIDEFTTKKGIDVSFVNGFKFDRVVKALLGHNFEGTIIEGKK